MVIDDEIVIPAGSDVEIKSTNGATIVATDGASHFRIGGKLRLDNLVLTNGSARAISVRTTTMGRAIVATAVPTWMHRFWRTRNSR